MVCAMKSVLFSLPCSAHPVPDCRRHIGRKMTSFVVSASKLPMLQCPAPLVTDQICIWWPRCQEPRFTFLSKCLGWSLRQTATSPCCSVTHVVQKATSAIYLVLHRNITSLQYVSSSSAEMCIHGARMVMQRSRCIFADDYAGLASQCIARETQLQNAPR